MAGLMLKTAEMSSLFPIGSTVRYSQLGLMRLCPRNRTRLGIVEGYAHGGRAMDVCAVRIRWGSRKTTEVLHRDYLELVTAVTEVGRTPDGRVVID